MRVVGALSRFAGGACIVNAIKTAKNLAVVAFVLCALGLVWPAFDGIAVACKLALTVHD